jgi:hypothetical protein
MHRGTENPTQRRTLEQILIGRLAAEGRAETGVNLPRECPHRLQQPVSGSGRCGEQVRAGTDVEQLAGSAKRGVSRDVGDASNQIEALVEDEGQPGSYNHPDPLPNMEHSILDRDPGGQVEAGRRTEQHLLGVESGARVGDQCGHA